MNGRTIDDLLEIMARLRAPECGCPWDLEQTFATIAPYTIEEAYEVAEAIAKHDWSGLEDELGDLLFQVVFHARMAEESGYFTFADVIKAVCDKMVRRHPHVFGDRQIADARAQTDAWEAHKAAERAGKKASSTASALDGVALALPALSRAIKLQARAARVGFDWPDSAPVVDKIIEELGELSIELTAAAKDPKGHDAGRIGEEFGDLLFACANLARHLEIDPEAALRQASAKFERRFRRIEDLLDDQGKSVECVDLDEMEALWQQAKAEE